MTPDQLAILHDVAKTPIEEDGKLIDIEVMTAAEFVEKIFFRYGYDQLAGSNYPVL